MGKNQSVLEKEYTIIGKYAYREKDIIACGGQGEVYKGLEINNHDNKVAIKILKANMNGTHPIITKKSRPKSRSASSTKSAHYTS